MQTLGKMAAGKARPVPVGPHLRAAAAWLESHDLAVLSTRGELALLDDALQTTTRLMRPMPVCDPPERRLQSLWSLRKQLQQASWTCCPDQLPSVENRVFHGKNQCHDYYIILLDCALVCEGVTLFVSSSRHAPS